MKKDIEKQFFKAFQLGGIVHQCIDVIRHRYDLGFLPQEEPLSERWQKYYEEELPNKIKEVDEKFDKSIIDYLDSSLIDEIESNLTECIEIKDKERYIFSLLAPFKELSDLLYPHFAIKERIEKEIKHIERNKLLWAKHGVKNEAERQIKACEESIIECDDKLNRVLMISNRFFEITQRPNGIIEKVFIKFSSRASLFGDRLDALLLTNGIDFMRIQKESGIYLIHYRDISIISDYIGSLELTQKYIDELPIQDNTSQIDNNEKYAEMAIKTKREEFLSIVSEYSFLSLDAITALTEDNKVKLINLIIDNKTPYAIAMLDHLGYINLISKDYRLNNTQVYNHLHKALNCSVRNIKGNLLVLNPNSKEKRETYAAETYIEIVRKDYKKLMN